MSRKRRSWVLTEKESPFVKLQKYLRKRYLMVHDLAYYLEKNFSPVIESSIIVFLILFCFVISWYHGSFSTWFLVATLAVSIELSLIKRQRTLFFQTVTKPFPIRKADSMETCDWMNEIVERIYFTIVEDIVQQTIQSVVYPMVDEILDPLGVSVRIEELDLGKLPPRVDVIRSLTSKYKEQVLMDMRIKFVSEIHIVIAITFKGKTFRIHVHSLAADLLVRSQVRLHPAVPLQSVLGISLFGPPKFDLVINPFYPHYSFDLMSLPFIGRIARFAIQFVLNQMSLLAPNYFCMTLLGQMVSGFSDDSESPIVDLSVLFPIVELLPSDHRLVGLSLSGRYAADLNWSNESGKRDSVYLTYRRAQAEEKLSPIVSLSLIVEDRQLSKGKRFPSVMPPGFEIIRYTSSRKMATLNDDSSYKIFLLILRKDKLQEHHLPPGMSLSDVEPISQIGIKFDAVEKSVSEEHLKLNGWNCLRTTSEGLTGSLNGHRKRNFPTFLWYKGGIPCPDLSQPPLDAPPITDIGIAFSPKEKDDLVSDGWEPITWDMSRTCRASLNSLENSKDESDVKPYLCVRRDPNDVPIVFVSKILADVSKGEVKNLKEHYTLIRKSISKAYWANYHQSVSNAMPKYFCVRKELSPELPPINRLEVRFSYQNEVAPPPEYELMIPLAKGNHGLKKGFLFARRIPKDLWQQKIQQKSVEKKEEEEEQSIEEVEISVMEPEEDSSGAIEQISFYSAAQDLATPPENWKMVEESYNHKRRFFVNGVKKGEPGQDLSLCYSLSTPDSKMGPISKISVYRSSSSVPAGWSVVQTLANGQGDACLNPSVNPRPYLMVYRSHKDPVVAIGYARDIDLPVDPGWLYVEGSKGNMDNGLILVYQTESSRLEEQIPRPFPPEFERFPIIDLQVVFLNKEPPPTGYTRLTWTSHKEPACLNNGALGKPTYICYKRGAGSPITDVSIFFADREKVNQKEWTVLYKTPNGADANLNSGNKGEKLYLAFKREGENRGGQGRSISKLGSFVRTKEKGGQKDKAPEPVLPAVHNLQVVLPYFKETLLPGYNRVNRSVSGNYEINLNAGTNSRFVGLGIKRMLALQRPAPMEDFQLGCNLTVVGAKSLIAADSNGKSDPYVVAHFGQMQKKSGVMKKTLNPTWNLSVPIPVWLPEDILYLKVWDADLLDDDFLGGVAINYFNILEFPKGQIYRLPLEEKGIGKKLKQEGVLEIKIQITKKPLAHVGVYPPVPEEQE